MGKKGIDTQAMLSNTGRVVAYARKHHLEVKYLNDGLQIRVMNGNRYIDIWPSTHKFMPNGGSVDLLPTDDKKFENLMKINLNVGKNRKKKQSSTDPDWAGREFFCRHDRLLSMRDLFKRRIIIQLVRRTNRWGKVTWHMYEEVTKYSQSGWQLKTAQQVDFAKQLADEYGITKKEWKNWQ